MTGLGDVILLVLTMLPCVVSKTYSNTYSNSNSNTYSNTYSNSNSNTYSNTYSNSNSKTYSKTKSPAIGPGAGIGIVVVLIVLLVLVALYLWLKKRVDEETAQAQEQAERAEKAAKKAAMENAEKAARLSTSYWKVTCTSGVCARDSPSWEGARGLAFHLGEVFGVSSVTADSHDADANAGTLWLKLATGEGWLPATKAGSGELCEKMQDGAQTPLCRRCPHPGLAPSYWKVNHTNGICARDSPSWEGARGRAFGLGEVFGVSSVLADSHDADSDVKSNSGILWLKLATGEGWLPSKKAELGELCERMEDGFRPPFAMVLLPRSVSGGRICNACFKRSGDQVWCCFQCNFDICLRCHELNPASTTITVTAVVMPSTTVVLPGAVAIAEDGDVAPGDKVI